MFRGRAHPGMASTYAAHLREVAAPHILSSQGVREVDIYEPLDGMGDFIVKSTWDDVASLMSFTGADWNKPRVLPTEKEMLREATVSHFRPGSGFHAPGITTPSGSVSIDPKLSVVEIDGEVFGLPPVELRLLSELARRPGLYVDPVELARSVWRGSSAIRPNDVRRSIYRLRKLIHDDRRAKPLIRSRRGLGYMIEDGSP